MGERWAGELCQENYNAPEYFSSEKQDSVRWSYYRCRTEGQNTIVYGGGNQVADAVPHTRFGTTSTGHRTPEFDGGPFWVADLTNAYNGTAVRRGVKLVGGRKQVVLQDEIRGADKPSQWRMHTNATVAYSQNGKRAREYSVRHSIQSFLLTMSRPATQRQATGRVARISVDRILPHHCGCQARVKFPSVPQGICRDGEPPS